MPEAPIPCEPAGLGPSNQPGDMNIKSQINSPACAGEASGHDAAACVSACGKCAGACVRDARDASELPPTTIPLQVRQVVAPQVHDHEHTPDAVYTHRTEQPAIHRLLVTTFFRTWGLPPMASASC